MPEDDPQQHQSDITQAREILGWEPKVQLEAGLKKTIEYFAQSLWSRIFAEWNISSQAAFLHIL
jgi:dTDP-D-glucose 4,6-dehydratase